MESGTVAPPRGRADKPFYDLDGFARLYVNSFNIRSHNDVRTEQLANAFRQIYGLSPFPSLSDLTDLCHRLEIPIRELPFGSDGLDGANIWHAKTGHAIYLKPDLTIQRGETTLGHEIREVLEHAMKRVRPWYEALDTSNNKAMNQESDQFAGCLLMQGAATVRRLQELGYDLPVFAAEKGRSLPSVIRRVQELFPAMGGHPAPVLGIWLFEAPWDRVLCGSVDLLELRVTQRAHLRGFSMRRRGRVPVRLAHAVFPKKGSTVLDFQPAIEAINAARPTIVDRPGFDLFGDHNFVVMVEPFFVGGYPWRVLMCAIRNDGVPLIEPWLDRLRQGAA